MKRVSIRDVAKEAGVSIATVSNALNNSQVVHPKTREHVLAIAESLHYTSAQNPKRTRPSAKSANRVIGLFVSSMTGEYYSNLADSMFYELLLYGYDLEIYMIHDQADIRRRLNASRVDGAVIFCGPMNDAQRKELLSAGLPVVFLDQEFCQWNASCVLYHSYETGRMAAEYLLGLGHRDLMHVRGIPHNYDSAERQRGFEDVLKEKGIPLRKENILEGRFERAAAYREMHQYLSAGHQLPEAIFASNDLSAIGVLDVLHDFHIRVPEDVSIIGCDDNRFASFVTPSLTTIRTHMESVGKTAAAEIMRLLAGEKGQMQQIAGSIIVRRSCAFRK